MLLAQVKALVESIRLELVSLQDQIRILHDAYKADRQTREEIPARLYELRVTEDEKRKNNAYRKKNFTIQVILAFATCGAFIAAAIYAGIASSTLTQMKTA